MKKFQSQEGTDRQAEGQFEDGNEGEFDGGNWKDSSKVETRGSSMVEIERTIRRWNELNIIIMNDDKLLIITYA